MSIKNFTDTKQNNMNKKETDLHMGNGYFMNIKTSNNVTLYESFTISIFLQYSYKKDILLIHFSLIYIFV